MNIILAGNGFDLHHKFPTRYIDFLHVIQFLVEHYNDSMTTLGNILGDSSLHNKNEYLQDCYTCHKSVYDQTDISSELVKDIISRAEKNMWLNYLCNCVSKNIQWIDFEKEISRVLRAFESFVNNENEMHLINGRITFNTHRYIRNVEYMHIVSFFDFFYEKPIDETHFESSNRCIKHEYILEKVAGSNMFYLATDDIVCTLYDSLHALADLLRDYLKLFVDTPSRKCAELGILPFFENISRSDRIYTFNYTNTFEIFYQNVHVSHIHGNTNENIVLGINPDENDEFGGIDTTFLQFKKYFQRVFYKTDQSFLNHKRALRRIPSKDSVHLFVIGHSLDTTDEDIIRQVFDMAKSITILYHSETSVKNQIRNLVEIYGKEEFDELRESKDLCFAPQSTIHWEFKPS